MEELKIITPAIKLARRLRFRRRIRGVPRKLRNGFLGF